MPYCVGLYIVLGPVLVIDNFNTVHVVMRETEYEIGRAKQESEADLACAAVSMGRLAGSFC